MRTVVTYLDKSKNRTTKENAWTVMTQVFNDAGNLQRTGYSVGEAQTRAGAAAAAALTLRDEETGAALAFHKPLVRAGRDSACDIVCDRKEDKKKIDKQHASFELRQGVWHVIDQSKGGVWVNGERIATGAPIPLQSGDLIDLGQRKKLRLV